MTVKADMVATVNRAITTSSVRLLLAFVVSAATGLLLLSSASAHAAYASSTPGFAEIVDEAPTEITIRFTQELFRREGANSIRLTRSESGAEIALGALGTPEISNDDRQLVRVEVEVELSLGRYLVSWTNLSAEDGDSDSGSFPFYVGREPTAAETELDRELASELLIAYPDDETGESVEESAAPVVAPAVARAAAREDASLGVGPIVWLAVGLAAALALAGTLGFHLGKRTRARQ